MSSEFPRRLRKLREDKRPLRSMALTSELMGLSSSALSKYERGKAIPTAKSLAVIADYYHVSMDYLWGRTNY